MSCEGFGSEPTFLDRLSILFSTPLLLASLAEHQRHKNVAANSCGNKKTWVSTGINYEVSPNAVYQAAHLRERTSREVYKHVVCPRQFALRFIHLTLQSRAGLCLSHLISSPFDQNRIFHCTDIYRIHRGRASQKVPVKSCSPSAVPTSQPTKRQDLGWLVQVFVGRGLRHSSRRS
jgi:hypothetical protein